MREGDKLIEYMSEVVLDPVGKELKDSNIFHLLNCQFQHNMFQVSYIYLVASGL